MNHRNRTVLVTGATGRQGGVTAHRLLADGWHVKALVRDPDAAGAAALRRAGAEPVTGDFDDRAGLAEAMTGVHGVFAVPGVSYQEGGWPFARELRHMRNVVDAAAGAGVSHLVFTGIGTVGTPGGAGFNAKEAVERHIRDSGVPFTLLRPVRFMENHLLTGLPVNGISGGVHRHLFLPHVPAQMIALEDIGVFAALAFGDPDRYAGEALELAGDAVSPVTAAEMVTAATGRAVSYRRIDVEEAAAMGDDVRHMWTLASEGHGWVADIPALRRSHPGLQGFADWLHRGGAARLRHMMDAETATG
ncbi:uncharacterized protein YbjT (DUF2867 family) [Stackebrandtia albiflava]|uniref:Uncharacterized protein YbjT (DUF2867 family) n=1 Tax=Stackebrandtia albiflava TaxID=406432 RepID=A0A562VEC9_9ACTN|nr:NmrA family NAD(P)-binding protein [Stackebrandtia albiflava]TWJ16181.1 uncharacterized protein YbjT (DUF2867 family) [Stackebrandtia albiflava]